MKNPHEIISLIYQGKTFEYAGRRLDQPKNQKNEMHQSVGDDGDYFLTPDDDDDDSGVVITTQGSTGGISISGGSGTFGNVNYGSIIPSGGAAGNLNWSNPSLNFTSGIGATYVPGQGVTLLGTIITPKSNVRYIIVTEDGDCMEMIEQNGITPREMINLCKFITFIGHAQNDSLCVYWSDLVSTLGIDRHFKNNGLSTDDYEDDTPTLNIFLCDPT